MKTWSGLDAPLLNDIDGTVSLVDIVVHLDRTIRFGGAGAHYSVLQHSMLVALLWVRAGYPRDELLFALLHDAHEYVLGDTTAPVKRALRQHGAGDAMKLLEAAVDRRIYSALNVAHPEHRAGYAGIQHRIKVCDLAALIIESTLFGPPGCAAAVQTIDIEKLPTELRREVEVLVQLAVPELGRIADARAGGR